MVYESRLERLAVGAFMALVTCFVLVLLFAEATKGLAGAPGVIVYGVTAAFGLEFICSAWTERTRHNG